MSFIHEKALIDLDVKYGKNFWASALAVVNTNEGGITIGDNVSAQECCVVHGKNVEIGSNVTIGHGAVVHGCKIGSNVLVGMNSTILDGAVVKDWSIVGAGAVVLPGAVVEGVWVGIPARKNRDCTKGDKTLIVSSYENYLGKLKKINAFE